MDWFIGLDVTGREQIGIEKTGSDWTGLLDWMGLDWSKTDRI